MVKPAAQRRLYAAAAAAVAVASLPTFVCGHAHEGVGFHISHEERAMNEPFLHELRARFGDAPAVVVADSRMHKRQATSGSTSRSSSSSGGLLPTGAPAGALSQGTIPIGVSTTAGPTSPLPTTYAAGATAPVSGAPALPNVVIDPSQWPTLDRTPPTDSAQVQQWMSQIDWTKVPNIAPTQLGGCSNASNAAAVQSASTNGWWTCGGYTRSSDVVSCPKVDTWGLSYDDGPSPDTPRLLQYLLNHNLKSTFFVVGSRAISRPQILQYEYMAGHQLSVHTWEHPFLTTKSNAEIVASLGWTKYAIKQITGVTPNTMRPPYGDIDDRVRAIALQMGLTPIIWTTVNGSSFDTFDWQVAGGIVNADTVVSRFQTIIDNSSKLSTGFIVLEHDLYQQSTSLAIDYVLPYALAKKTLTLQPIHQCLGLALSETYIETASNKTGAGATSTVNRNSQATNSAGVAVAGAAGSTTASGNSAGRIAVPALAGLVAVAALAFAL